VRVPAFPVEKRFLLIFFASRLTFFRSAPCTDALIAKLVSPSCFDKTSFNRSRLLFPCMNSCFLQPYRPHTRRSLPRDPCETLLPFSGLDCFFWRERHFFILAAPPNHNFPPFTLSFPLFPDDEVPSRPFRSLVMSIFILFLWT